MRDYHRLISANVRNYIQKKRYLIFGAFPFQIREHFELFRIIPRWLYGHWVTKAKGVVGGLPVLRICNDICSGVTLEGCHC